MEYGYVRISTPQQNIERQIRNIKTNYPNAFIVQEIFTGTKIHGRKELDKILRVNLVFLKEPHINTDVYKRALKNSLQLTGTNVDYIIQGINQYLMALAKEQIQIAFDEAEKEVLDLRQRTKEGIETARLNGKQIGQKPGKKLITKKSIKAKGQIQKYNKSFEGSLTNEETWKLIGISRATFYKYKKELQNRE